MRLTYFQQQTICEKARLYFGDMTHVWLFGSRVDDTNVEAISIFISNLKIKTFH